MLILGSSSPETLQMRIMQNEDRSAQLASANNPALVVCECLVYAKKSVLSTVSGKP